MSCYIFCKECSGKTKKIYLNSEEMKNMEVLELKRRIDPGNEQGIRLIYGGKQLQDGCTVGAYNIQNGSTIYVVEYLPGGGLPPPEDEDVEMPRTESMEKLAPMQQTEPESSGSCWIL